MIAAAAAAHAQEPIQVMKDYVAAAMHFSKGVMTPVPAAI